MQEGEEGADFDGQGAGVLALDWDGGGGGKEVNEDGGEDFDQGLV